MTSTISTLKTKPEQKVVAFRLENKDIQDINQSIGEGWAIVQLVPYENKQFVGIMEKFPYNNSNDIEEEIIYIPPKKKISFS